MRSRPMAPVRLAITMGDPSGIGPEVLAKSLPQLFARQVTPYVLGDAGVMPRMRAAIV